MSDTQQNQSSRSKKNKQILYQGVQGASLMGKTYAIIGSILSALIAIIFIVGGIMIINNGYTKHVQAKITKVFSCEQRVSNYDFICDISFSYIIDNKEYIQRDKYESYNEIQPDDLIDIFVNKNDPNQYKFNVLPQWLGIFFIVLGIFIIFFTFLYLFFILRYKGLAVISGLKRVVTA